MIPADIVQIAQAYVTALFKAADTSNLYFHSLQHSEGVVEHVNEIGAKEHVTAEELQILQVAAWFHDVGHLNGGIEDHETRSVDAVRRFFESINFDDHTFIQRVESAIMATRMPHVPGDKLEEIICDADIYNFGTSQFRKTNKLVEKELKARGYPALITDWNIRSLRLMQTQHFFTPYSRQNLEIGKAENVRWLKRKIEKKAKKKGNDLPDLSAKQSLEFIAENSLKASKKAERETRILVSRGIQTLLRLASSNHLDLSRMADGKANILISVNSIIISVILSIFLDRLDASPELTIPTILFLASSVTTVIIAILATRPKLTEGTFTKEDIRNKQTNLMFFGNFYKSRIEDYTWAMDEMMRDKDYLYDTLVKDIFYLGRVLGRKYKLIRLAYNVFMVGLIVAVLSFTIAIVLTTPSSHTTVINANGSPL